jgi:hypothetical protein
MKISPWIPGIVCACLLSGLAPRAASAQTQEGDTLRLLPPANVRVFSEMRSDRRSFTNYIFWDDLSKTLSTLVHKPDTTGWHPTGSRIPTSQISMVSVDREFPYTGSVDRTIKFSKATGSPPGEVGVGTTSATSFSPSVLLTCNVEGGKEILTGQIDIGQAYVPGSPIGVRLNPGAVDLGFRLVFSEGYADSNATFKVGLEDFEGYHQFRGTRSDGTDLINIGEISKEDAFVGEDLDSLYFAAIVPALRETGRYSGFGMTIDIRAIHPMGRLGENELFWLDSNAFNGFTYRYLVTSYDRGYSVSSGLPGLSKFDHCPVTEGVAYPCPSELVSVATAVEPQNNLPEIYAVPNPYRSGSSQFTTENYHNFPDNKLRFVNVPRWCDLKVYTPAGDIVWEFSQTDGPGNIEWDTKNLDGQEVSSGVYIYRLESESGDFMYGRIIIIR